MFKLIGISYKLYGFRLKGQRSKLGLGLTAIRRGFELYECLLVLLDLCQICKTKYGIMSLEKLPINIFAT